MTARKRLAGMLLTAAAALTLTGCDADVATRVHVRSATAVELTATVTMHGEAAGALRDDEALRAQLEKVFTARLGVTPAVDTDDEAVVVSSPLTYAQLLEGADVLGVSSAASAGTAGDDVTVTVTLADPSALRKAITDGVAGRPDSAALARTLIDSTTLTTQVVFDGGIASASTTGSGLNATTDGDTVTLRRELTSPRAGTLTVTGNPTGRNLLGLGGLGLLGVATGVFFISRARR